MLALARRAWLFAFHRQPEALSSLAWCRFGIAQPATGLHSLRDSDIAATQCSTGTRLQSRACTVGMTHRESTNLAAETLGAAEDSYDGIIVDADQLPEDANTFEERLQGSLQTWRKQRRKGIWLKVPIQKAALINAAVDAGFIFHHAEATYLMLTQWLSETENTLPANASHQVGVGAFVLNEHEQVLVVQEAYGPLKCKAVWKLPTGLCNALEDVPAAAVREVLEETGIHTSFAAILACRQAHGVGMARNKSDMFFVVALKPNPGQEHVTPQESELEAAKWMPLQEFGALQFLRQRPLHSMILDRCLAYAEGRYSGLQGFQVGGGLRMEKELLLTGSLDGMDHENASRL